MSGIPRLDLSSSQPPTDPAPKVYQTKKVISIALSILMALGMILSYALGAPWPVILLFFALALACSWSLSRKVEQQAKSVLETINLIA